MAGCSSIVCRTISGPRKSWTWRNSSACTKRLISHLTQSYNKTCEVAMTDEVEEVQPDPNEELVRVFDTQQESEALVVQGLLQSAGIDAEVTAIDATQDILPGVGGTIVLVREEDADEARRVIAESRELSEVDDTDVNAGPAA